MPQSPALRGRIPNNQAGAAIRRIWHNRNRALMERIAAGLRALDRPPGCKSQDPMRGYAHAHQVMAVHAGHRCPRYDLAARYTQQVRP